MSSVSQFFSIIGIGVSAYYFITLLKSFMQHVKLFLLPKDGQTKEDFAKKYGPWAVITGATAGIGLAYAKELASRKMNIVLIGRREEKLKRVAAEIENEFSVQSKTICVDFAGGRHVYEIIQKELRDLQIGILVNNVGVYKYPAPALEMTTDFMWNMVHINCIPVIMMTKFVLPGMKENGRGAIVNVSSIVESTPSPSLALYAATKGFITVHTKALQFENRGCGVTIQILSPAAVNTMMTETGNKIKPDTIIMPNATDYVEKAVTTLGVLDHTSGYHIHSLLTTLFEMIPRFLRISLLGHVLNSISSKKNIYLSRYKSSRISE